MLGERDLRVSALDKALQLAARARDRDRRLSAGRTAAPLLVPRLLNQPLQFFGVLGAPLAGLFGSDLQCDRKELLFITGDMRVGEGD